MEAGREVASEVHFERSGWSVLLQHMRIGSTSTSYCKGMRTIRLFCTRALELPTYVLSWGQNPTPTFTTPVCRLVEVNRTLSIPVCIHTYVLTSACDTQSRADLE